MSASFGAFGGLSRRCDARRFRCGRRYRRKTTRCRIIDRTSAASVPIPDCRRQPEGSSGEVGLFAVAADTFPLDRTLDTALLLLVLRIGHFGLASPFVPWPALLNNRDNKYQIIEKKARTTNLMCS